MAGSSSDPTDPGTKPTGDPTTDPKDPNVKADPTVEDPATNSPPTGPVDGDPSAPLVAVPDIACGGVVNPLAIAAANVQIGGRGAMVDYPCGKHEGARVVFILNLHGTMPNEALKFYQQANFSAYRLVAPDASGVSPYNIVVVSPKSVATTGQWGNMDGGADRPYLFDVIDWTYKTFSKFQIEHMWVVGHSFGAGYTADFACSPELKDKVQGVVLMSGGPFLPAPGCIERLSILSSKGEKDLPGIVPLDLTAAASGHGCGPLTEQPDLGGPTKVTSWDCPAGTKYVFRRYLWMGRGHQISPGDWAHEPGIDDMVDSIMSVQ
jgi:pimeloyl-ACP methyl ester carboxylesterase